MPLSANRTARRGHICTTRSWCTRGIPPPAAPGCPDNAAFYTDFTVAYPAGVPPWVVPGTSWGPGVEYTYVDGMPAVHFFDQQPYSCTPLS